VASEDSHNAMISSSVSPDNGLIDLKCRSGTANLSIEEDGRQLLYRLRWMAGSCCINGGRCCCADRGGWQAALALIEGGWQAVVVSTEVDGRQLLFPSSGSAEAAKR
jgi:hypothetical protein